MKILPLVSAFLLFGLVLSGPSQGPARGNPDQKKKEKKFVIEMHAVPWAKVFSWLADQTGLPFLSRQGLPPGHFTFVPPKIGNAPRQYTLAEFIDVLNEALKPKYLLVRREKALVLAPADEKLFSPILKAYSLSTGNAEALVKILRELSKGSSVKFYVINPNTIWVHGSLEDHVAILTRLVQELDRKD